MPNGLLLLDKPRGLSSNRALQTVRRAFGARRAGHVGTLDPLATGMLPICLDEATKIIAMIEGGRKAYSFGVSLGIRTSTGDAEGEPVESLPVPALSAAAIEAVLAGKRGEQSQTPPMYSALKRDGEPLYRLARAGIEVERAPRRVVFYRLELMQQSPTRLRLECECSKGTYVRVLAEEIAAALGTCGHVDALRRLWVEPFLDEPMLSLDAVLADASGVRLLPPDRAVDRLPALAFAAAEVEALRRGQSVSGAVASAPGDVPRASLALHLGRESSTAPLRVRLYRRADRADGKSEFLGLGEVVGAEVRPRRLFVG
jgi:tRNA pseudouridine55 synthase